MPYWAYGHDAKTGLRRDPLFFETEDEADARRQAEQIGMVVEELELVAPSSATEANPELPKTQGFHPNSEVVLATTPTIEGRPIKRYVGIVSGTAIVRASAFTFVGGPSATYVGELQRARELALADLETAALAIKANAVVGLQFQFETASIVSVTGTAVIIEGETRFVAEVKSHHITA
jgi:uncharacterized protein YbjQ (UPF0145 family)